MATLGQWLTTAQLCSLCASGASAESATLSTCESPSLPSLAVFDWLCLSLSRRSVCLAEEISTFVSAVQWTCYNVMYVHSLYSVHSALQHSLSLQLTVKRNTAKSTSQKCEIGHKWPQLPSALVRIVFSQNKQFKKGSNQILLQLQWTLAKLYREEILSVVICIYKAHPQYTKQDYSILHSHYSQHSNHCPCYCYFVVAVVNQLLAFAFIGSQ